MEDVYTCVLAPVHAHVVVRGHVECLPLLVSILVFETMAFTGHKVHTWSILAGLHAPRLLLSQSPGCGISGLFFSCGSCFLVLQALYSLSHLPHLTGFVSFAFVLILEVRIGLC